MEIQKIKSIIEAILFAAGRIVSEEELMLALELDKEQIEQIIRNMQEEYKTRGIEIIKVEKGFMEYDGELYNINRSGTFANAPTPRNIGFAYFATDKGKAGVGSMIYYTGDSTTPWVYSDGTAVS